MSGPENTGKPRTLEGSGASAGESSGVPAGGSGELPGLDLGRFRAYLDEQRPGLRAGELTAELIAGGRSNLTYSVSDGVHDWVLRRPPLGHVLATAHDMGREYRVITALRDTAVPVPTTVLLCADPEVLGAPFYLMDRTPGQVLRTRSDAAWLRPEQARALSLELVEVLADLHAVAPESVGLADFGRPDGFLTRQVNRWKKQLDASRSRELAGIDDLHAQLGARIPESGAPAILHGDYRLGNVLVGADPLGITGVLDWEMSTLGDPLTDLGLLVVYNHDLGAAGEEISGSNSVPGLAGTDELIAHYAQHGGRDVGRLNWYVALSFFKLAVIVEGIHFRFVAGKTVGAGFDKIGKLTPLLVSSGLNALAEES
ncbi:MULTISPECIES: phosphotransferase family protein [unclassified Crossiella]|uniref:phosphotransferase family protein n=1 Tax=unclassified Crossiella TaxID=2620835 RepID=UPI001FFE47E8|nr:MULTISPECIES: phosphotransferase family protein [unclassified Crossiella]MCK2238683.1 phosphotransferase family protein [Crossiella sp. S99.2]MCK2251747.1 phosphotransferase family protein [Crossiella sp. S99.1]